MLIYRKPPTDSVWLLFCSQISHLTTEKAKRKHVNKIVIALNFLVISPYIGAHLKFRFYMKLSVGVHVSFHVFSFVEWAENLWVVDSKLHIPVTARTNVDWKLPIFPIFLPQHESSACLVETHFANPRTVQCRWWNMRALYNAQKIVESYMSGSYTKIYQCTRLSRTRRNENKNTVSGQAKRREERYKQTIQMVILFIIFVDTQIIAISLISWAHLELCWAAIFRWSELA